MTLRCTGTFWKSVSDRFWPTAVLGALFIGIVSWLINLVVPDGKDKNKNRRQPPPPPQRYQGYQYR